MTPAMAGLLGFGLMIVLVMLSVNVDYCIIISGILGLVLVMDLMPALSSIAILTFERATDYSFAVIPLFMLMSSFIAFTNIGKDAYTMSRALLGQLRGGLAMAT